MPEPEPSLTALPPPQVNFDALCAAPGPGVAALVRFLASHDLGPAFPSGGGGGGGGRPEAHPAFSELLAMVRPPSGSIGRFRQAGLGAFDPADVEYVAALGFDVEPLGPAGGSSSSAPATAGLAPGAEDGSSEPRGAPPPPKKRARSESPVPGGG